MRNLHVIFLLLLTVSAGCSEKSTSRHQPVSKQKSSVWHYPLFSDSLLFIKNPHPHLRFQTLSKHAGAIPVELIHQYGEPAHEAVYVNFRSWTWEPESDFGFDKVNLIRKTEVVSSLPLETFILTFTKKNQNVTAAVGTKPWVYDSLFLAFRKYPEPVQLPVSETGPEIDPEYFFRDMIISGLPVVPGIGKTVFGEVLVNEKTRMEHLLVFPSDEKRWVEKQVAEINFPFIVYGCEAVDYQIPFRIDVEPVDQEIRISISRCNPETLYGQAGH